MSQTQNEKKKFPSLLTIIIALGAFLSLADAIPEDTLGMIILIVFLLLPVVIVFSVARKIAKSRKAKTQPHSHDRIDHQKDIKINPNTGKTEERPVRTATQHTPQEHWKQQLDGLLANGTIDRAEYRAMMKRRF